VGEEVKAQEKSMEDAPVVGIEVKTYTLTPKKLWALGGIIVSLVIGSAKFGNYMGVSQKDLAVLHEQERCMIVTNDFNRRIGAMEIESIVLKRQLAEKGILIQRLAEVVPNDDRTLNGVDVQVAMEVRKANAPKEEKTESKGIMNKVTGKIIDSVSLKK